MLVPWPRALGYVSSILGRTMYVHSFLRLSSLIKMSTTNPGRKSVVLESSARPSIYAASTATVRHPMFGLTEDLRTTDSEW